METCLRMDDGSVLSEPCIIMEKPGAFAGLVCV